MALTDEMIISAAIKPSPDKCSPTFSSWKLYNNPLFALHPPATCEYRPKRSNKLGRPRRSSIPDLTFTTKSTTESSRTELGSTRAQIVELKAELEMEHKMRKRMESLTKRMIKGLAEERRGREAAEQLCFELAKRVRSKCRDQRGQ